VSARENNLAMLKQKKLDLASKRTGLFWTVLSVLIGLFVTLLIAVKRHITLDLDHRLLLVFRNPLDVADPIGPLWFEEFVRDISALGSTGVLTWLTLIVVVYAVLVGKKSLAIYVGLSVCMATVVNNGLKSLIDRSRPDVVNHVSEVFTQSFPSGHAMLSAVVYLTFALLLIEMRQGKQRVFIMTTAVLTTLLVGMSRIYLGVHWPSDVVAGWLAAATWLMVVNRLWCRYAGD
jgi:undecaprenyl-diphosphatase